jgi:SAM-dependent methyltransferase
LSSSESLANDVGVKGVGVMHEQFLQQREPVPPPSNDLAATNWLYREPAFFDKVHDHLPDAIGALLARDLAKRPDGTLGDVLDIGCGTGRVLKRISALCNRIVGADINEAMIAYAKKQVPNGEFVLRDMRNLDELGSFDLIICTGSVLMYLLSNGELFRVLSGFREHIKSDGTLVLGMLDSAALIGREPNLRTEFEMKTPGFHATGRASWSVDGGRQRLYRSRTWKTSDGEVIEDRGEYRLLFPLELEFFLERSGFSHSQRIFANEPISEGRLFVAARP